MVFNQIEIWRPPARSAFRNTLIQLRLVLHGSGCKLKRKASINITLVQPTEKDQMPAIRFETLSV